VVEREPCLLVVVVAAAAEEFDCIALVVAVVVVGIGVECIALVVAAAAAEELGTGVEVAVDCMSEEGRRTVVAGAKQLKWPLYQTEENRWLHMACLVTPN
jgi:hypothetical protein